MGTACLLSLIHNPGQRVRLRVELVERLHGLTPTEAALAVALTEGQTLSEYAAARGKSEQTARTHLKRIFDKTATTRQAELVGVLLSALAAHHLR